MVTIKMSYKLENSYNAIMDEFRKIAYINDRLKLDEKQFNVLVQKQAIEKTSVGINKRSNTIKKNLTSKLNS